MGIGSWFKSVFREKKEQSTIHVIEPIPILRTETPDKIIETQIRPVKVPTIIDIGERLALISRDLSYLKNDMVSKSWFKSEYEYAGTEFIEKISTIESKLKLLEGTLIKLNNLINNLSDLDELITKPELIKINYPIPKTTMSDGILNIILKTKKIRYKDIRTNVNTTDPTLSKYLKLLLKSEKIKKIKKGKAVFYTPF